MSHVIATNVRYLAGGIARLLVVSLGLVLAAHLVLPTVGVTPPADGDFRFGHLYAIGLVVTGSLGGFLAVLAEIRERRSEGLVAFPLTRYQLAGARVLTPLALAGCGLVAGEIVLVLVDVLSGLGPASERALTLVFIGA
jgi:hypothetical protein